MLGCVQVIDVGMNRDEYHYIMAGAVSNVIFLCKAGDLKINRRANTHSYAVTSSITNTHRYKKHINTL